MPRSEHLLTLGSLVLCSGDPEQSDYGTYDLSMIGDDFDRGAPVPVDAVIETLIQDGARVVTESHENREVSFRVRIRGVDSIALSDGEAALHAECSKRNQLVWRPNDGGIPTVFEVETAHLEPATGDNRPAHVMEARRRTVFYRMTLTCSPFARSLRTEVTEGIVTGPGGGGTAPIEATIVDGTSPAGWSPQGLTGPDVVAGELRFEYRNRATDAYSTVRASTLAVNLDMSTTPYLTVDFGWDAFADTGSELYPQLYADGAALPMLASILLPGGKRTRYTFSCPDDAVTALQLRVLGTVQPSAAASNTNVLTYVFVDNIRRTNGAPSVGSDRQKLLAINVRGTARTPASLAVEHPNAALGKGVIVYTYPDDWPGFTPDLYRWGTFDGAGINDSQSVSGRVETLATSLFTIPSRTLPRGEYLVMLRLALASGTAAERTIQWVQDGVMSRVTLQLTNEFTSYVLGTTSLPYVDVPRNSSLNSVMSFAGTASDVLFQEGWTFCLEDGYHLSILDLGKDAPTPTGTSNRLWIDAPGVERDTPAIWRGTMADRSDARFAGADALPWDAHEFAPPRVNVFVVTPNAADAKTSLEYYPRWHTRAAL